MKLQRIFMVGCMVLAIALVSCSGEDGTDGLNGMDGADGATGPAGPAGATGADGADGMDGIACWDLNGDGIGNITEDVTNEDVNGDQVVDALDCQGANGSDGIDGQDGNSNVVLVNVDISNFDPNSHTDSFNVQELTLDVLDNYVILAYLKSNVNYVPVPGIFEPLNREYAINYTDSSLTLWIYDMNGQPSFWSGSFNTLQLFLIEPSNLGGKSQADVMASLKAAGVDTSDYKEVAHYFGIE